MKEGWDHPRPPDAEMDHSRVRAWILGLVQHRDVTRPAPLRWASWRRRPRPSRREDAARDLPRDPRTQLGQLGVKLIELRFPVDRAPRRCQRRGMVSESLGLTSHKSSCNCTGCGMLRAGVCINCAEKAAALILESGLGDVAVEPCSGACREAIELYFSAPPERWRAPLTR